MITADQYELLDMDAKANIVWQQGTFLSTVMDYGRHRINIYELNAFFVGVFYCVKENKIKKIEILTTGSDELFRTISPN